MLLVLFTSVKHAFILLNLSLVEKEKKCWSSIYNSNSTGVKMNIYQIYAFSLKKKKK